MSVKHPPFQTCLTIDSVQASDVDIHVDDTLLTIHINPYFLRLNFPHPVSEEDGSAARYDAGAGFLYVTLNKQVKGQEFKDLDPVRLREVVAVGCVRGEGAARVDPSSGGGPRPTVPARLILSRPRSRFESLVEQFECDSDAFD